MDGNQSPERGNPIRLGRTAAWCGGMPGPALIKPMRLVAAALEHPCQAGPG